MKRSRQALLAAGASLGAALVVTATLLWHQPAGGKPSPLAGCTRYVLIPTEWFCGKTVVWVNPDGSRVRIGATKQVRMPRPRPVQSRR